MTFYDPSSSSGLPTSEIDSQNRIIHRGLNGGMGVIRLGRWPSHPGLLNSMALSPDGKTLAIGNFDGKIRLFTLK
jgi:WD40 repeat protein